VVHAEELTSYHKVKHIMTPREQFAWLAADCPCSEAKTRLQSQGYTYAPLQLNGDVLLIPLRSLPDAETPVGDVDLAALALPRWLWADDELRYAPAFLQKQPAYLVRERTPVVGLLHYSDLNKLAFRGCVYHQIAALEAAMLAHVSATRPEPKDWKELLAQERIERAGNFFEKHKGADTELTVAMELYIDELVGLCRPELAERLSCAEQDYHECVTKPIKYLRDKVAHVGKAVVNRPQEVERLANTLEQVAAIRIALST